MFGSLNAGFGRVNSGLGLAFVGFDLLHLLVNTVFGKCLVWQVLGLVW